MLIELSLLNFLYGYKSHYETKFISNVEVDLIKYLISNHELLSAVLCISENAEDTDRGMIADL